MQKSQIQHLEQILAQKRYGTFFLGHPVHGAGFRSLEDVCYPGFIGSLCQAAPYMSEVEVLKDVVGGEEVWAG